MLIKKIYGLIGKDIDYSFSRNYFNSKFKKLQILENEYINFDLKNISGNGISHAKEMRLGGLRIDPATNIGSKSVI